MARKMTLTLTITNTRVGSRYLNKNQRRIMTGEKRKRKRRTRVTGTGSRYLTKRQRMSMDGEKRGRGRMVLRAFKQLRKGGAVNHESERRSISRYGRMNRKRRTWRMN